MAAALGPSLVNTVIAIAIPLIPQTARVIRANTLALREMPFVEASKAVGMSEWRIAVQHILPNTLAPLMLSNALVPLMQARNFGRIVNVSSGMGQLDDMGAGHPAYRVSKAALNAVTRVLAAELVGTNIKVNALCPGWVRTDMGGQQADRSPQEGIETTLWLAQLPEDGPSGGFFRDRRPIPW